MQCAAPTNYLPPMSLSWSHYRPTRVDVRELLNLAIPIVMIQVGMMLLGVVDTIMVGHVSAVALAAVALGNLYTFGLSIFGLGVLLSLDPIVAQALGAKDEVAINEARFRSLFKD